MTLALRRLPAALLYAGLLGSAFAAALGFVFGERYAIVYGPAGLVAVMLDLIAIRATSNVTASIAALLKPVVFVLAAGVIISGQPSFDNPILAPSTGPLVLLYSSIPSIFGAISRRWSR